MNFIFLLRHVEGWEFPLITEIIVNGVLHFF